MAIFTPGPLMASISGNLLGVNFVKGKFGPYLRRRQSGVLHDTEAQLNQRALFRQVQSLWPELTEDERKAWRKAARDFPVTNRLGRPRPYSGFQLFTSVLLFNQFHFPLAITTPPPLPRAEPFVSLDLTFTAGGTYEIDVPVADLPTVAFAIFYAARPMTQNPITSFKRWRFVKSDFLAALPINVQPEFDTIFGPPDAGETIGVRAIGYLLSTNRSFPFETKTVML